MPLILNGNRIQPRHTPPVRHDRDRSIWERIHIGLINNMPDAALEDTENHFFSLLEAAAGDLMVHVSLYSLPEIIRGDKAQEHMRGLYSNLLDLRNDQLDALIITGTEPCNVDLRNEVYWRRLADLFDWAERETVSTVLSCLATHSSVLHSDGIERHRLSDKLFGLFEERKACDHFVTTGVSDLTRVPHSRWNEVREEDLVSCGYVPLMKSQRGGVGLFAKQKRKALFLYFQGHPEYSTHTLLKEYRRDIRRFIRRERETYPSMPSEYFDVQAAELLTSFRGQVLADPREDLLACFPYDVIAEILQNDWHLAGVRIYRNWLEYIVSQKDEAKQRPAMSPSSVQAQRVRSAMQ